MIYRIFYAAGPGNVIQAHKHWMNNEPDPTEMSITYSSQVEDLCRDIGAEAYIVSSHDRKEVLRDGPFVLEHRPKPMLGATGVRFHLGEILYGFDLLAAAVRFQANTAILASGSSHYFMICLFRLFGIQPVIILHNTLWPSGFRPTRRAQRLVLRLAYPFFRWSAKASVGLSPECIRQVDQLTHGKHGPLYEFRSQFRPEYFKDIPPPPPHDQRPFRIMYSGRIDQTKGIFDILQIAKRIEQLQPGRVEWEICGTGPDLAELKQLHQAMGLQTIVFIRGWTSPQSMKQVLARSHLSIVPTRGDFAEGMAKTAVEAILSGRPVITNPVVPALEMLEPACIAARTDDVESYVQGVARIINDPEAYRALCEACPHLQRQFFDSEFGLKAVLKRAISA